jgi:hypothetical protein
LEGGEKVLDIASVYIFDAKIFDNRAEGDEDYVVIPNAWGVGAR